MKCEVGSREESISNGRLNADQIQQIAPGLEQASSSSKGAFRKESSISGIMPIGLLREPHKQKELVVATTAELEARGNEGSIGFDDNNDGGEEIPEDERVSPEELAKAREMNAKDTKPWEMAPSAEPMVKLEDGTTRPMNIDDAIYIHHMEQQKAAAAEKKKKKAKDLDAEEQAAMDNIAAIMSELGVDDDGEPQNKHGRVYLFQVPPVLPMLFKSTQPMTPSPVKAEPVNDDVFMPDVEQAEQPTPVDLTGSLFASSGGALAPEPGYMGKMVVRKSGKVELDWGGLPLSVRPGTRPDFVSRAVIIETDDVKNQGQEMGSAIDVGKIMGRFVSGLVIDEGEDWDEN